MKGRRKHKLSSGFQYKTVTLNYPIAEDGNYLEYCFEPDDIEYINLYNYFDRLDCVCDIDTNVGMTEVVFYISFKYDTPDEIIKEYLEKAIEIAWNNTVMRGEGMKTVTMKSFDRDLAWDNRINIPVSVEDVILVDGKREYKIINITIPKDRENRCPWYTLTPVNETLEEHKREHDNLAKKNHKMISGQYPDFSFQVDALWFFSRNVSWE